ncbi:MAG: photosystem I assembly protein Ycf4 [Merismopedia sp. SIO2A8]|nr:photosystem I assembly protein Ycf4 [Merismopedia sp. SIO2A8]
MAASTAPNSDPSMKSDDHSSTDLLRQDVLGSRRFSNYFFASIVAIGGIGFLLSSLSIYFHVNLIPFSRIAGVDFIPQGAAMGFYGVAASLLSLYLWLAIVWDIGGGYNEFDKRSGEASIVRQGFPGKNRQIEVTYSLSDTQAVKVVLQDGLNTKRCLYLRVKGRADIPLTRVGQPLPISALENQGAELARFLEVPLEGL